MLFELFKRVALSQFRRQRIREQWSCSSKTPICRLAVMMIVTKEIFDLRIWIRIHSELESRLSKKCILLTNRIRIRQILLESRLNCDVTSVMSVND